MPVKTSNTTTRNKSARMVKKVTTSALPVGKNITVRGKTPSNSYKSFSFHVLSASQQMKERNKAYSFFSLA
jgi:hypothetical protein